MRVRKDKGNFGTVVRKDRDNGYYVDFGKGETFTSPYSIGEMASFATGRVLVRDRSSEKWFEQYTLRWRGWNPVLEVTELHGTPKTIRWNEILRFELEEKTSISSSRDSMSSVERSLSIGSIKTLPGLFVEQVGVERSHSDLEWSFKDLCTKAGVVLVDNVDRAHHVLVLLSREPDDAERLLKDTNSENKRWLAMVEKHSVLARQITGGMFPTFRKSTVGISFDLDVERMLLDWLSME
eukprot:TRINITY_DN2112_c0_g1_i1.p1 TRINITY_DN2112_c0_g1~~TRINITY_DN2112_c0_g1_i1.p1  ORF type:complete len:238 (-),score=58.05 TRINITY_DN2112_c0_g1_i1:85-798(-)